MLPDFLIVGAMKSGTSTLHYHLRQHGRVFMPPREVHFFDDEDNYRCGQAWYERHFDEAAEGQVVGEKTPTYSYLPWMPERIYDLLPSVKLVWIFRNPTDRSYSNYWHAVKQGSERLSFPEAVRREKERIAAGPLWHGYVERSVYVRQVQRFLPYFDLEDMHFILLEDLKQKRERVLSHMCDFLGVEASRAPASSSDVRKYETYLPRSGAVQHAARALAGRSSLLYRAVSKLNRRSQPGYPDMPTETRARLNAYFAEPNRRLEALTGIDVSRWK